MDATCVPWPFRSCTAALFEQSLSATSTGSAAGVSEKMNEHDAATSRFGAMSGWVRSTPESITPTRTPSPFATACDPDRRRVDREHVPLARRLVRRRRGAGLVIGASTVAQSALRPGFVAAFVAAPELPAVTSVAAHASANAAAEASSSCLPLLTPQDGEIRDSVSGGRTTARLASQ